MHVPSLIKNSMVARLDNARIEVKVQDVLVRRGVTEEDASEVVMIQLAPSYARPFNANTCAKHLEIRNVKLAATPSLVGGFVEGGVDKPIMEIGRMHQSRRPNFRRKAGSIKQCANFHGQGIVIICTAILRGAVRTSWLDHVVKLL